MTREGKESERKVTDVAHIRNTSSLAEFCRQPQNNLFKKVQAEFNSPITNYGVRDIKKCTNLDIKGISSSVDSRPDEYLCSIRCINK